MPTSTRKLNIFLCHASQDQTLARELYQRLIQEGWIEPWLSAENLLPGMDWDLEIRKAVRAADAVLICLSNNSVTKEGYVQRELRLVLDAAEYKPEGAIFILPLRLDDCTVPFRLEKLQYINYFPPRRRDAAYGQLRQSLALRAKTLGISGIEVPAVVPEPASARSEPPDPLVVGRIRDLEDHLRNAQKLLKEYEDIFRLSSDPRERARAQNEIKGLQTQIRKHQKELNELTGKKPSAGSSSAQIINIHGDFVAGDKVDRSISVGNISNSTGIAIGDDAHANSTPPAPNDPSDAPLPDTL